MRQRLGAVRSTVSNGYRRRATRVSDVAAVACLALAGGCAALLPGRAGAQPTHGAAEAADLCCLAQLRGYVRDPQGNPIALAGAELDGSGSWVPTYADGQFRFTHLAAGPHVLRVRALGFDRVQSVLTLGPLDSIVVEVRLVPADQVLDTVRAVASPSSIYGPPEFQERRQQGRGYFVTRGEFEQRVPTRMTDLLVNVPGVMRRPVTDEEGVTRYLLVMRGVATVMGNVCPVQVYVDGVQFELGHEDIDLAILPGEVEALEVYVGASQVPQRYAGRNAACGLIMIWTRNRSIYEEAGKRAAGRGKHE